MTDALQATDAHRQASADLLNLLGRWFEPAINIQAIGDWREILSIAIATKTVGLLGPAVTRSVSSLPPEAAKQITAARRNILIANLHNVDWTVKTIKPLQKAGIDPIVFKGALRARAVYSTWDARRSSDIDLLVRPEDYDRARQILIADGMISQVPDTSSWWHHYLGESPYARPNTTSPIVDLHHSVQQPGGPYPTRMDDFFKDSVVEKVGSSEIRMLSAHHALLVCAINYGKAVRARKPWLAEMHEFSKATRFMNSSDLQRFMRHAEINNLQRLVGECFKISETVFPKQGAVTDELAVFLNSIGIYSEFRFDRLARMWNWIDGNPIIRSKRFTFSLLRILRTEIALRREGLASI